MIHNIVRDRIADDIVKTMTAAGYAVRENDPFTDKPPWSSRPAKPLLTVSRLVFTDGERWRLQLLFCLSHGGADATLDRGL